MLIEIIFFMVIFGAFGSPPDWFNYWKSSKDKKRQANIMGRFLLNSTDVDTIHKFILDTRYLSPDLAEKLLSRIDELKAMEVINEDYQRIDNNLKEIQNKFNIRIDSEKDNEETQVLQHEGRKKSA